MCLANGTSGIGSAIRNLTNSGSGGDPRNRDPNPRPNTRKVPLGDGLADNAQLAIGGRRSQIDEILENANTGLKIPSR